jgi:hypothetical protein
MLSFTDGYTTGSALTVIGVLLFVLILVLIGFYSRNRSSFQSIWYRSVRRQHRIQTNAIIRGATLPPPILTVPLMGVPPPMMGYGRPMMPGMGLGLGPAIGGPEWVGPLGYARPPFQSTMPMPPPPPPHLDARYR